MGITCSPLPQNNGNLPLPFLGVNDPNFHLDHMDKLLYMYINWFIWIIFFIIVYEKIWCNKNSPILST